MGFARYTSESARHRCRALVFVALLGILGFGCGSKKTPSGTPDAGAADAGPADAGAVDAGAADAGPEDAGSPPSCHDGLQNGSETDLDCGGTCAPCGDGKGCAIAADCADGVCEGHVCQRPSCQDHVRNGDESDVDCGGSCPACVTGDRCRIPSDCHSGLCGLGGICRDPSCNDGLKDGSESDVDCGGDCGPCPVGKSCGSGSDCVDGSCKTGLCAQASCSDGVKNASETDVDCGGACPACPAGEHCAATSDCATGVCSRELCVAASCTDGVLNGGETDVDCGGTCPPCLAGAHCASAADCSGRNCVAGVCQTSTCNDHVQNGTETDVDCGGGACPACANGAKCKAPSDCAEVLCTQGLCQSASCSDHVQNGNETDVDCGGSCAACKIGQSCLTSSDCATGQCMGNVCRASCQDGVQDGDETAVDCGGSCMPCAPPDPVMVAPPNDPTVPTTVAASTAFLYSGPTPIQTGVAPGTMEPKRVAVLRGRVLSTSGLPLQGVTVTVVDHPELGQTVSRADGAYDLAVNGGGPLVLHFEVKGLPVMQRRVNVPWQDFVTVDDLVMLDQLDAASTIDFSTPVQIAQASPVTDSGGTRQSVLLFFQGTQVGAEMPDGTSQPLTGPIHVRSTEYTNGTMGPSAMPGTLPDSSGYTYATEFTVDEALAVGAKGVSFSQPVVEYLDNFLHFTVGQDVPSGYYDRNRGVWVPSPDGRVVKVLSVSGGTATLDVDGSGQSASSSALADLSITPAELQEIASLYQAGQSLWRIPLMHFSAWDFNWGSGPPDGASGPGGNGGPGGDGSGGPGGDGSGGPGGDGSGGGGAGGGGNGGNPNDPNNPNNPNNCSSAAQSTISAEPRTMQEDLPTADPDIMLHYESSRVPGRQGNNGVILTATESTLPPSVTGATLELEIAGRKFTQTFSAQPGQTYTFIWDGLDAYGRQMQGLQPLKVHWGYTYPLVYLTPARRDALANRAFGHFTYFGTAATADRGRQDITLWNDYTVSLAATGIGWDNRVLGFGGWSLSVQHAYDPVGRTLYLGTGETIKAQSLPASLITVAGGGSNASPSEAAPAGTVQLDYPLGVARDAAGNIYIADTQNDQVRKVDGNGRITTVAGTGTSGYSGDHGPAAAAELNEPSGVAVDSAGNLYIADRGNNVIRRVTPDGTIDTFAGTGQQGFSGDGASATSAELNSPSAVAVDRHETLYIADTYNHRIREVTTDGLIDTVAGTGTFGFSGDGGPAAQAQLDGPAGIAVDTHGNIYVADTNNQRIRRIDIGGKITTVAGNGQATFNGDGKALEIGLNYPQGVAVDESGIVYIADTLNHRVRQLSKTNVVRTIAGTGVAGFAGEGGPATSGQLNQPVGLTVDGSGALIIADQWNHRVRRIASALPGFSGGNIVIASPSGGEVYVFDQYGRHLQTIDARTQQILRTFTYDAAGYLVSVTDRLNRATVVTRDSNENPVSITSPAGVTTSLTIGTDGYLSSAVNPAGGVTQLTYSKGGLIATIDKPTGGTNSYTFDGFGNLITDEGPDGGTALTLASHSDGDGGTIVTVTNALGATTTYDDGTLDGGGTYRVVTDPNGAQTTTLVLPGGATRISDPNGTVTELQESPDPRFGAQSTFISTLTQSTPTGLFLKVTDSRQVVLSNPLDPLSLVSETEVATLNGLATTRVFDFSRGKVTTTTPEGRTFMTTMDANGWPTAFQVMGGPAASATFDAQHRLTGIEAGVLSSSLGYDDQGRPTSVTNGAGETSSFTYDQAGKLASFISPSGHTLTLTHDVAGRLTQMTLPSGAVHGFGYRQDDRLASHTLPGGAVYQLSYDAAGRRSAITLPTGAALKYQLDLGGRLLARNYPEASVSLTFSDATKRPSQLSWTPVGSTQPGEQESFTFDGQLVTGLKVTGAAQGTFGYQYDNSFNLVGVTLDGVTRTLSYDRDNLQNGEGTFHMTRGPAGELTEITDGTAAVSLGAGAAGVDRTYSVLGKPVYSVSLGADAAGRVAQRIEAVGSTSHTFSYTYDHDGRVTEVQKDGTVVESYAYDADGNRTSRQVNGGSTEALSYDAQGRLTQSGNVTYQFDADGVLLSRGNDQFHYSRVGELLSAELASGQTVTYGYNGFSQRVSRTDASGTTQYLHGNLKRPWEITAVRDPSGTLTTFYYDDDLGFAYAMQRGGTWYYIATDQVGSPVVVTDASGQVVKQRSYDSFGNLLSDSAPGFDLPIGYAGGLADAATGLVRFGARDYDPATGRFTTRDPLLLDGRDLTLYGYAGNNPISYRDPSGLCYPVCTMIIGGVAGALSSTIGGIAHGDSWGQVAEEAAVGAGVGAVSGAIPGGGVVAGALTEMGGNLINQVADGVIRGDSVGQAVSDINLVDTAISGGVGAVGSKIESAVESMTDSEGIANAIGADFGLHTDVAKIPMDTQSAEKSMENFSLGHLYDQGKNLVDQGMNWIKRKINGCP